MFSNGFNRFAYFCFLLIFFKKKNKTATIIHTKDILGNREFKYDFLLNKTIHTINWNTFPFEENKPWRKINEKEALIYESFLSIKDVFINSTPCIRTHNDKDLVSFTKFQTQTNQKYLFKAFDFRFVDYDLKKIGRSRISTMYNFLDRKNIGLIFQRGSSNAEVNTPFITNILSDQGAVRPGTTSTSNVAPLYLYPEAKEQTTIEEQPERVPNFNMEMISEIEKGLDLQFVPEKENGNLCFSQNNNELQNEYKQSFAPIDVLDYIYAVLHSPSYREKYKEFLKIDFPRVPYPTNKDTFWKLVDLGSQIRQMHLLESPVTEQYITQYPEDGDNVVGKPRFVIANEVKQSNEKTASFLAVTGRVYINDTQYFDNVPETAWNFYIGGYQPAQKWLKDRKDRTLDFEDILHYQKIIVALTETDRLMREIDKIIEV